MRKQAALSERIRREVCATDLVKCVVVGHLPPPPPPLPSRCRLLTSVSGAWHCTTACHLLGKRLRRQGWLVGEGGSGHSGVGQCIVDGHICVCISAPFPPDVCLPALYMPTPLRHTYTPRAHQYFHPSGKHVTSHVTSHVTGCAIVFTVLLLSGTSSHRVTQPPSIFQLPALTLPQTVSHCSSSMH